MPTLDEKAWRATEPHTPHPRARLEAVAELNRIGIPTGVLIAPLMPGINDGPGQVERIVALAEEAGATSIGGQALFLRGSTRDVFFDWLRAKRPDLVERYERLYRKGAYLPPGARKDGSRRGCPAGGAKGAGHAAALRPPAARAGAAEARAGAADQPVLRRDTGAARPSPHGSVASVTGVRGDETLSGGQCCLRDMPLARNRPRFDAEGARRPGALDHAAHAAARAPRAPASCS